MELFSSCMPHNAAPRTLKDKDPLYISVKMGRLSVRLIDYIVGRVSGRYIATHPAWYRRERKTPSNDIYNNKFRPAAVTDSSGDRFQFQARDSWQQAPRDNMHYSSHYFTGPISRPDDQL